MVGRDAQRAGVAHRLHASLLTSHKRRPAQCQGFGHQGRAQGDPSPPGCDHLRGRVAGEHHRIRHLALDQVKAADGLPNRIPNDVAGGRGDLVQIGAAGHLRGETDKRFEGPFTLFNTDFEGLSVIFELVLSLDKLLLGHLARRDVAAAGQQPGDRAVWGAQRRDPHFPPLWGAGKGFGRPHEGGDLSGTGGVQGVFNLHAGLALPE